MTADAMDNDGVTTVVFDLGGVLIDWDPRRIFQNHFATRGVMEAFMTDVFWRAHHACHDTDAPFAQTLEPYCKEYPHFADAFAAIADHWQRALIGPIPEMVALLDELVAKGTPVFALSNWPAQTWPPAHPSPDEYDFLSHFRDIVVSGQVGLRKPDPAIYTLAMRQFGLKPGEAIFIDDLAVNARAAEHAGMIGHQFISVDRLRTTLGEAGLI